MAVHVNVNTAVDVAEKGTLPPALANSGERKPDRWVTPKIPRLHPFERGTVQVRALAATSTVQSLIWLALWVWGTAIANYPARRSPTAPGFTAVYGWEPLHNRRLFRAHLAGMLPECEIPVDGDYS